MPAGPDPHLHHPGGDTYYEHNNNHVTSASGADESAHSIFQSVKEQVLTGYLSGDGASLLLSVVCAHARACVRVCVCVQVRLDPCASW